MECKNTKELSMKSILLTTTALVAFAGAAAAGGHTSINIVGNTELGYNTSDPSTESQAEVFFNDDEDGLYLNLDIDFDMNAELDNGVSAQVTFELDLVNDTTGGSVAADEFLAALRTPNATLYIGETQFAAESLWKSAGDMESDGFSEADEEIVLRADFGFGNYDASVSVLTRDTSNVFIGGDDNYDRGYDQLSLGFAGDIGMFSVSAAYQEESQYDAAIDTGTDDEYNPERNGDFNTDEIWGLSGSVNFSGADVTLAYVNNTTDDENSTGIKVAYPFGPLSTEVYYVSESNGDDNWGINVGYVSGPISLEADYQDDQGAEKWALEGGYEIGEGFSVFAGTVNDNGEDGDYYVGADYALGAGSSLLVSYAVDEDGDQEDEIGTNDYQNGTTFQLSFSF
jgi:hypothetical protein